MTTFLLTLGTITAALLAIAATLGLLWLVLHQGRWRYEHARSCAFCGRRWYGPWWLTRRFRQEREGRFAPSASVAIHHALSPQCKRDAEKLAREEFRWDSAVKRYVPTPADPDAIPAIRARKERP